MVSVQGFQAWGASSTALVVLRAGVEALEGVYWCCDKPVR